MSAAELNEQVLGQLALGNVIGPQESAKERVATLVSLIDQPYAGSGTREEQRDALLEQWNTPAEELLAVLYPVVEYGDERALGILSRCIPRIAEPTALASQEQGWNRLCGVVTLGRLVWAVTAYSLHCRRLDALAELSRISIREPFGHRRLEPLIAMSQLRYPGAFGQNAGIAYADYREWLQQLVLVHERYPLFASEVDESLDEADVVLALRAALEGRRVHSVPLDTRTVRRFADHALDPLCRPALARTFRCSDADLNDTLERAFTGIETDQYRFDRPRSIFGNDD